MAKGAILTGLLTIVFGLGIFSLVLKEPNAQIWVFVYPIIIIIIGISIIIFRKEESKIEQRKDLKPKKSK